MTFIKKLFLEFRKYGLTEILWHILFELGLVSWNTVYLRRLHYYSSLDPENYPKELKEWFLKNGGTDNIDRPTTFNGKIQWLKLHDTTAEKTRLADKYLVRTWIKETIGGGYLIPIYGVYNCFEEINFESLPKSFVIKANHGTGMNIIVKDKNNIDQKSIKKKIDEWMQTVFGYEGLELQYINIPRKIMIEKYIEEIDGNLFDYKIHCFHGSPLYIQVIGDRNLECHTAKEAFYSTEWELTEYTYTYPRYEKPLDRPCKLQEMLDIAKKLSENFLYVRVDLYLVNGNIFFGEMTFTPANGIDSWNPPEANEKLGDLIRI